MKARTVDIILETASLLILVVSIAVFCVHYTGQPAFISSWFSTISDAWGSDHQELSIAPLIIAIVSYIALTICASRPTSVNYPVTEANRVHLYPVVRRICGIVKFVITAFLAYITIAVAFGWNDNTFAMMAFLILTFILVIYSYYKISKADIDARKDRD